MKKTGIILTGLIFLLVTFGAARAATFVVTKTADTNDGACDADCSLREALSAAANSPQSSDIIEFSAFFDAPRTIFINFQSLPGFYEPLAITKSLEIRGKSEKLVLSGDDNATIFNIYTPSGSPVPHVVLRDLQLTRSPGAVYNDDGDLTIENCLFLDNTLNNSKFGGAALHHHSGVLVVNNSTFDSNLIPDASKGGAISLYTGTATIMNSTFTHNSAVGGSVFYSEFGTTNIINSTISYNTARADSGASGSIVDTALGNIVMTNVTATGNTIHGNGTTVGHRGLEVNRIGIRNTIIAGNTSVPLRSKTDADELLGIFSINVINVTSLGHNLVGFAFPNDGFPPGLPNANGDYVGDSNAPLDPLLDQLDANGGVTETHALLPGSLAIDHGTPNGAPVSDQRGVARPFGIGFDIGAFETGVTVTSQNTPTGANVNVALGTVSVTFSGVSQDGTTGQIPIEPTTAGTLPGGFSFGSGLPAFQISTTALYSAPVTVCLEVSSVNDPVVFNALSLFHYEHGQLVNRTTSRDFPSRAICAQTSSLSPFAVAQNLAPTAAGVSVSGRVSGADGRALPKAIVSLTDSAGQTRAVRTNSFGNYRFDAVAAGQTVVVGVNSKLYRFEPRVLSLSDSLADVDFTPLEEEYGNRRAFRGSVP